MPKTVIFAKDDHHAEKIVKACWEVFGQGNEFAKKITYQTSEKPKELIAAFRVDPFPRIAWLRAIKDYLAANVEIAPADLMRDQPFSDWGGVVAARRLFSAELNGMPDELTEALVA